MVNPNQFESAEQASEDDAQLLAMADSNEYLEALLNERYAALIAQASESVEGAQKVLAGEEAFFNTFNGDPQAEAKWDKLKGIAEKSLAGFGVAERDAKRANDADARREAGRDKLPVLTDPWILRAEAKQAYELGLLAQAAYGGFATPYGWREVQVFSPETTSAVLRVGPAPAGFRAVLYEKLDAEGNGTGKYILAFAGTDQPIDWLPNIGNGMGHMSAQYQYAVTLTREIATTYGRQDLSLLGHSLGGGLASTASVIETIPATVFNPAGVNTFVVHLFNFTVDLDKIKAPITVYRVKGEVLTTLQDSPTFLGGNMPDTIGRVVNLYSDLGFFQAIPKHSMETVLRALEHAINKP
jgi:hypothetical protein